MLVTDIDISDIMVTTEPEDAVNIEAVYWYNIDTGSTDDATFTSGSNYGLGVILSPKDGYAFNWDSSSLHNYTGTAAFNNGSAGAAWSYQDSNLYMRSQGILAEPLKAIEKVDVSGMPTEIIAGESTDIDISDLTVTTEPENAAKIEAAYWYNIDTQTDQDTNFKQGNRYGLVAILSPQEGYAFNWDSSSLHNYTGAAAFNSEEADVAWSHQNKDVSLYMRSQGIKTSSVIYVNDSQFTENNREITCGSGKATYDPETNTLTLDNAKIEKTYLGYGIYAESALNIVLKGDNSTTNLYGIKTKGDLTVTGEGSLNVKGTGQTNEPAIYADGGKTVFDCSGDIAIDSKTTCVSATNDVTFAGSGNISMSSSRSGSTAVESVSGDVIISGSGEVNLKGDAYAVGADLKLNGEATPITLSAFYSGSAVKGTVAGTAVDDYNVTGDPASASVIYELKTPCSHDNTVVKDAKDASCTEAGYTGDTYCEDCGEKIAEGDVINIKAHTYGEWKTITEPTLTEKGEKVHTCSVCGAKETQEIPVLTPITYTIIAGANGEWTKNSTAGLAFTSDADFAKFVSVKVDGSEIAATNYTAVSGSTKVTMNAAYLETLSEGSHSLEIVSSDGSASTNFTVKAAEKSAPVDPEDSSDSTMSADPASPQTGDNSHMFLWILLLLVSSSALAGITIYGRKKRTCGDK